MKLNNIKLIHTDDIPINYNNNENNYENVFIYDKDNNNINNITYACPIYFNTTHIKNEIIKRENININNGFLLYSFMYQISFGHFIEQVIPKINFFINLKKKNDIILLIPEKRYNLLLKEIINLIGINDIDIIVMNRHTTYNISNFYYSNYNVGDFNIDKIISFNFLREKLLINNNLKHNRNVYLKKNEIDIENTDCYNIGKTRKILNEHLLIDCLTKLNFEIITLGECDLNLKKNLLTDINIIITQIGGNMFNLIFSNTPKHIIFLSNTFPLNFDYINTLLPKLNYYTNHTHKLFKYNSYEINCDVKNNMNDPFIVNIKEIVDYIYSL